MKKISIVLLTITLLISFNANAWFFFIFPIPSFSGSGETCLAANLKVGDSVPSPIGGKENNAIIKAVSGSSSRCKDPMPNLGTVEFNIATKSKASIDLPDEYQPQQQAITDLQKFNGITFIGSSKNSRSKGLIIFYRKREPNTDPAAIAQAITKVMTETSLADASFKNEEQLQIKGMNAWRFEISGKVKGIFGSRYTYQYTILEDDEEFLVINPYTKEDSYETEKQEMQSLAFKVTGIKNSSDTSQNKNDKDLKPKVDIENAKQKCLKLGFKEKTEKFGICVLEFIN